MTTNYPPPPLPSENYPGRPTPYPVGDTASDEPDTKDVAKEQAASVGQGAAQAGQHVAGVAKDQAGQVTAEAGKQAKELVSQAQTQLSVQAGAQQEKLVTGLQALSTELSSMAENAEKPGIASGLARQASERTAAVAGWLDGKEPGAIVNEVSAFARQRPGAFLALAAGAGLLAGRLTRGLKAQSDSPANAAPDVPATYSPPAYPPPQAPPSIVPTPPADATGPLEPPSPGVFPSAGYLGETPR